MRAWKLLVLVAVLPMLSACRSDPNTALRERELRLQEDRIWQLQDCIEEQQAELDSCRRHIAALKTEMQETRGGVTVPGAPSTRPSAPPLGDDAPTIPGPPRIQLPGPSTPSGGSRPSPLDRFLPAPGSSRTPSSGGRPAVEPAPPPPRELPAGPSLGAAGGSLSGDGRVVPAGWELASQDPLPRVTSRQVQKITLNQFLTGGYRGRRGDGHEGVMVVVEPRDAQNRIVAAPGQLSIVVIDPRVPGQAGRIARWDFAPQETTRLIQEVGLGRGMQIELPWPGQPPVHPDLHVFVRYTAADGRRLEADKRIRVEPPGSRPPPPTPAPTEPRLLTELQGPALVPGNTAIPSGWRTAAASSAATTATSAPPADRDKENWRASGQRSLATDTAARSGWHDPPARGEPAPSRPVSDPPATEPGSIRTARATSGGAVEMKRPVWSPTRE